MFSFTERWRPLLYCAIRLLQKELMSLDLVKCVSRANARNKKPPTYAGG